jgi:hypothetical protein
LGWLILAVGIGSIVVLKDLAFASRALNIAFSIALIVMVFYVGFALIVPSIPVQAAEVEPANHRAALDAETAPCRISDVIVLARVSASR